MGRNKVFWAQLADYAGHEISSDGQVRNAQTGQILKTSINQTGVRYVAIRNTTLGKYENRSVGTLVALAFCDRHSPDQDTVLHLDGNPDNNHASNLMWTKRWHAMAYHQEIRNGDLSIRRRVRTDDGRIFANVYAAATATGCLPSAIDYAVRYNDNMSSDPANGPGFVHRVYPGGHIFRSA